MNDYVSKFKQGDTSADAARSAEAGRCPDRADRRENPGRFSNYVDFLHPWGNVLLNPIVLLIMFFGLLLATIIALRSQDIG